MTAEPDSQQPKAEDPLVGLKLGDQFEVIRRLGAGGMGAVYLANQVGMGRNVVIKVMHAELSLNNPVSIERFMREVRAVGSLNHPHIVQVYTFGQTPDGRLYQAMEYIDGKDLCDAAAEGPFDQIRALLVIDQVASALTEAHAHGLVHRDLKPENIMVTTRYGGQEWVKVLDFGIAKLHADNSPSLTHTGAIFGTPRYMAPEQIRGEPVDARTDLYALGLILFELVTGTHPFKAETAVDYLYQHMHVLPPSPMEHQRDLHPNLAELIQRLLAKNPSDRISSAQELRAQILNLLGILGHTAGVVSVSLAQSSLPATTASRVITPSNVEQLSGTSSSAISSQPLAKDGLYSSTLASSDSNFSDAKSTVSKGWLWGLGAFLILGGGAAAYVVGSTEEVSVSAGTTYIIEPSRSASPEGAPSGMPTHTDGEAEESAEGEEDTPSPDTAALVALAHATSTDTETEDDSEHTEEESDNDEEELVLPINTGVEAPIEPLVVADTALFDEEDDEAAVDGSEEESEKLASPSLADTKYINFFLAPASAIQINKGFPMKLSVAASTEEVGAFFQAHYEDAKGLRGSRFTIRDPSNPWSSVSWTASGDTTTITIARRTVVTSTPVLASPPPEDDFVPSPPTRERTYRRDSREREDGRDTRRGSRHRDSNSRDTNSRNHRDNEDQSPRRPAPTKPEESNRERTYRNEQRRTNLLEEGEVLIEEGQKILHQTFGLNHPNGENNQRFRRRRPTSY